MVGVNDAVLDVLDGVNDDAVLDVLDGVSDDVVLDVFAVTDDPPAPADDVTVEPEPPLPDALDTLRPPPPPLEICAVPTAAARRESLVFLAPRSLRKSRRAFCGFGSSFPSDSRMSAWTSALGRGGAGDCKAAQKALKSASLSIVPTRASRLGFCLNSCLGKSGVGRAGWRRGGSGDGDVGGGELAWRYT